MNNEAFAKLLIAVLGKLLVVDYFGNHFKSIVMPNNQFNKLSLILQGPKYLRPVLTNLDADLAAKFPVKYPGIMWRGQLVSSSQNKLFKIKFYGNEFKDGCIASTEEAAQIVIAVDPVSNEEILIFDKARHGWDAFHSGFNEEERQMERPVDNWSRTKHGTETFRLVITAFYNEGTKESLLEEVDDNGMVELPSGDILPLQDAFDDCFDSFGVDAIDEQGHAFELIAEELA